MANIDQASVFATGAAGTSGIDSLTLGNGSLWAEYGNGASSTGGSGSSTLVQYDLTGTIQHSYSLAGSVDGLKFDPSTGQVWALVNQDGNSSLRRIDPTINSVGPALDYAVSSATSGYDDVAFAGGQVYLSYTNPAAPGDPVLQRLTNGDMPQGKLVVTNLLLYGATGTDIATGKTDQPIPLSDPDSLKSTPGGGLVLSSGDDNSFTLISDVGTKAQSERFVSLTNLPAGSALDDVILPTSSAGTFYVSNTGTNQIDAYKVSGLNTSDAYASVGTEIVQVDLQTGAQAVLIPGLDRSHGMIFVPDDVPGPVVQATSLFAIGTDLTGASAPDSVTMGDSSIFIEYGNNADATGKLADQGNSTIVQYSFSGQIEQTYQLPGSIDGLKYDPNSKQLFAMKNQDANSRLYLIDPTTHVVSGPLDYAAPYVSGAASSRGFDDVAFSGGKVFLSYTNPANAGDSVLARLDQGNQPTGALTLTSIVRLGDTGTNLTTGQLNQRLPVADPDSLKTLADGSLILTSDHDASLTFISHPGTAQQQASFVTLPFGSSGLDDAIVPTASAGTFYIANGGANDVLKVAVTGLDKNDIYVSVGSDNAVDQLDPTTGKLTPFIVGLNSPHGLMFVPDMATSASADAGVAGFNELLKTLAPSLVGDLVPGQVAQLAAYAGSLAPGGSDVPPPFPGDTFASAATIEDQLKTLFAVHTSPA